MKLEERLELIKTQEKDDIERNKLIKDYMPFVVNKISLVTNRYIEKENDEELLVGLEAFNEAIDRFDPSKGKFLTYAELIIRSRVMDFIRKERKHKKDVPIESMSDFEDKKPLEDAVILKEEVFAFRYKLSQFGLTVDDLLEGAPKRAKTLSKVTGIGREASKDETIATKLYSTKKLPMAMIVKVVKTTKKVLKTYRDFIVAVIIIYTENYEIIRQYLIKEER